MEENKNHIITYSNFLLEQATINIINSEFSKGNRYLSLSQIVYNKNKEILPEKYIHNVNNLKEITDTIKPIPLYKYILKALLFLFGLLFYLNLV